MHRTQVYLTDMEKTALRALARQKGKSFSATLREAIDEYLDRHRSNDLAAVIEDSFGCWRDQPEFDLAALRHEWSERHERLR